MRLVACAIGVPTLGDPEAYARRRQAAGADMRAANPQSVTARKDADGSMFLSPDDGTRIEIPA
jgi:hypothetical protein